MSFQFDDDSVYRVHRVLDIDDTCEQSDEIKDEEIQNLKKIIEKEPRKMVREVLEEELKDMISKKKSKRPRAPVDSKTSEVLEHPAYYITSEGKNICFNAKTMNDLGKSQSNWFHGNLKKFQNPPHHDFGKIQERFFRSAQTGDATEIQFLIKMGADINHKTPVKGDSPLFTAAFNGHVDIVDILLETGSDYDTSQKEGATPLYVAAQNGHVKIVEKLLGAGANIHKKRTDTGYGPLHAAAQYGHVKIVEKLLRAGANKDESIFHNGVLNGFTPLYIAARNNRLEVVKALLHAEANPDKAISHNDLTPLHVAAFRGNLQIVQALLNAGANVNMYDKRGKTPLDIALKFKHAEVIEELQERGAQRGKA